MLTDMFELNAVDEVMKKQWLQWTDQHQKLLLIQWKNFWTVSL
jgi:hypothetical protein